MTKIGNRFSRWMGRRVPPGLDWWTEVKWAVSGLVVGTLWSLGEFSYQFSNACNRLYDWVGGLKDKLDPRGQAVAADIVK